MGKKQLAIADEKKLVFSQLFKIIIYQSFSRLIGIVIFQPCNLSINNEQSIYYFREQYGQ